MEPRDWFEIIIVILVACFIGAVFGSIVADTMQYFNGG